MECAVVSANDLERIRLTPERWETDGLLFPFFGALDRGEWTCIFERG